MASGAKIALMFAFMAAMAMAVQAGNHTVSCKNNYCKPITVNGIVIDVNATVDVVVNATLTVEAENILGQMVTSSCGCPSYVTGVELSAILDIIVDLQVKVTACIYPGIVGTIIGLLSLNLAVCL